jgi:hypothetical protein
MKRDRLVELAGEAARTAGYAFHTGEEHLTGGTVRVYPAAWLAPPTVRSHTGREEGETRFRITLHLMALPTADEHSEAVWQRLEKDALGIASRMASSTEVCAVENVRCSPCRQSLTPHGETSATLECEITMWYCNR